MLTLILALAVIGFITWLIVTLVPMPEPFPRVIIAIACIIAIFYVLQALGLVSVGHLRL